ncbi:hypothetical protein AB0H76_12760 [Nocardia sp. NPDC050712]|uniref:hypothetical protein n=1 Tax=Nocardia sp. NPDC050712 TaxID=3155518 RepID=UPI0033E39FFE
MSDSQELVLWTYLVEITHPGDLHRLWWAVASTGHRAQVAAALDELATRVSREPDSSQAQWCRYRCEIRDDTGVLVHEHTALLPVQALAATLAATASRAADPDPVPKA